jgi:hypothetical protein
MNKAAFLAAFSFLAHPSSIFRAPAGAASGRSHYLR